MPDGVCMVPWPGPSAPNCTFCDLNHREHELDPFIRLIDARTVRVSH
jgi:hypothetical protein